MGSMYDRILALCEERGIKPGRVCADTGLSRGMMSDLKMGRTKELSAKNTKVIADYFGVSTDYLLGSEKQETPTPESKRELPHAKYREVLAEGGMRLLLDADAKLPEEHLEEIVEFIKMKQRKYGR